MKCRHIPERIPVWFNLGERNRGAICKKCGKRIYLSWSSALLQNFVALGCGLGAAFGLLYCTADVQPGSSDFFVLCLIVTALAAGQAVSVLFARFLGRFEAVEPKELLPKSKSDVKALERLSGLTNAELEPIIPELLAWMQDANWPIYPQILRFLRRREDIVIPHADAVLRGGDYIWAGWILEDLVSDFSSKGRAELKFALHHLAELQEDDEDIQKCSKLAREILEELE